MSAAVRVFVAGATGVLGKRVLKLLADGGHRVVAASRSAANRERLAAAGAEPREVDLFDAESCARGAEGCGAVLHLATKIPPGQRTSTKDWAENDRLRTDGTRALLAAAAAHGARYVQQSVAWIYGDRGEALVDERTPAERVERLAGSIRSSVNMEEQVRAAPVPWVILRGGLFYSADSEHTQMLVKRLKQGLMRVPGDGRQYASLIHVDDMAGAVLAATLSPEREAVFNVVDDEPVRFGELVAHLAGRVGRKPPGRAPRWLIRLATGKPVAETIFASLRASNRAIKDRLGWAPRFPTYREGFDQVLRELAT
jgi:nucleoside-diphosphate-sugar epimerase